MIRLQSKSTSILFQAFLSAMCLDVMLTSSTAAADYPPAIFQGVDGWGKNIQRTMRLLASSTPEKRNTVRILFYGQSITEQNWTNLVEADLRNRFPHADLVIENRALGGFASQLLVRTAETDLYPFQPDLLIFHVYGAHDKYGDIIRHTRERTCAEILLQTDHVTKPSDLNEETDPAKVPIQSGQWDAFFNYNFLPSLAQQYGAELCDQRTVWKAYLNGHGLEPKALLKDNVHLNAHGEFLMAEVVKAHLRRDSKFDPAPAEEQVTTLAAGEAVKFENGNLSMEFEGIRVDVVCKAGTSAPAAVRIDGRRPSEIPGLYSFSRAVTTPPGKWPVKWPIIAPVSSGKLLLIEDWTLDVQRADPADEKLFTFKLHGSKTGPDGEGRSDRKFISESGRIVIEPEAWNADYSLALAGIKPVPDNFTVKWSVVPHFVDELTSPGIKNPAIETTITLAQGLTNKKHTLEIAGGAETIAALRIYRPALQLQETR